MNDDLSGVGNSVDSLIKLASVLGTIVCVQ